MKKATIILSLILCQAAMAQTETAWPCVTMSVTDCMRYAVEHNRDVRISQLTQDSRVADRTAAIGAFLPAVGGQIGAQYNFGRAIDPETNTYTNVNTFYNGYSVSLSLPVFDGFQRLNQLRAAEAALLMGRCQMEAQRDELALQVFEAYCNVLYYKGICAMAKEKLKADSLTLRQTQVMCEVGQKSEADVVQMEAQLAADEYEICRQENALATAWLTLKQLMNWPANRHQSERSDAGVNAQGTKEEDEVNEGFVLVDVETEVHGTDGDWVVDHHPSIEAAMQNVAVARHQLAVSRGALFPSLSIGAGISTTYNKMLHTPATAFHEQMRNNRGEYVYATLSIPLFNRLQTVTDIRRQRNNLRIAEEQLAQKRDELAKLQLQAANDCNGYEKQTLQMQRKVEADSLAYQLTWRKYEEGLSSSIDVQTTSATLLASRVQLLQCRLMWALKQKLVAYYQGTPIIQ